MLSRKDILRLVLGMSVFGVVWFLLFNADTKYIFSLPSHKPTPIHSHIDTHTETHTKDRNDVRIEESTPVVNTINTNTNTNIDTTPIPNTSDTNERNDKTQTQSNREEEIGQNQQEEVDTDNNNNDNNDNNDNTKESILENFTPPFDRAMSEADSSFNNKGYNNGELINIDINNDNNALTRKEDGSSRLGRKPHTRPLSSNTIRKPGFLEEMRRRKELTLISTIDTKKRLSYVDVINKTKGPFDHFLQNEYEVLRNYDYNNNAKPPIIDSFWKTLIPDSLVSRDKLPDVVVIGCMKCGSTSLHSLLSQHPSIKSPYIVDDYFSKEAHFYDQPNRFFDTERYTKLWRFRDITQQQLLEEATPGYMYFPLSPFRMRYIYDQAVQSTTPTKPKYPYLIAVLRDPISRAYSQCNHYYKEKCSPYFFDHWVSEGMKGFLGYLHTHNTPTVDPTAHYIIDKMLPKIKHNTLFFESIDFHRKGGDNHKLWEPETLLRGMYSSQLSRWLKVFPRENFYFLETTDLNPQNVNHTMNDLFEWLGFHTLSEVEPRKVNYGGGYKSQNPILSSTMYNLKRFYDEYNRDLVSLLGRSFSWIDGETSISVDDGVDDTDDEEE